MQSKGRRLCIMPIALIEAIQKNNNETVIRLLHDDKTIDTNIRDEKGTTALLEAAKARSIANVRLLLQNRASPNVTDHSESTALMVATLCGDVDIMKLLLDNIPPADMWTVRKDKLNVNAYIKEGRNELEELIPTYAAFRPRISFNSALDYAARISFKHIEPLKFLLTRDKEKNTKKLNHALLLAATYGSIEAVTLLLDHGAEINCEGLFYCAENSTYYQPKNLDKKHAEKLMTFLVERGLKTNEFKNYYKSNPIITVLSIQANLDDKKLENLTEAECSNYTSRLLTAANQLAHEEKLFNRAHAMIAKIAAVSAQLTKPQNDKQLIIACESLLKISEPNYLDKKDSQLLSSTLSNPPIWMRGTKYLQYKKKLSKPSMGDEKSQQNVKPSGNTTKLNNLIDGMLSYLSTRNDTTGTAWLGYTQADYLIRREVTDKITQLKLKYEEDGSENHLNNMTHEINNALKRKDIKGRLLMSSHLFANHLRAILTEINVLLEPPARRMGPVSIQ
jgi:hypothetical protein